MKDIRRIYHEEISKIDILDENLDVNHIPIDSMLAYKVIENILERVIEERGYKQFDKVIVECNSIECRWCTNGLCENNDNWCEDRTIKD